MPITRSRSHPDEDSSDVPEHQAASTGEEDTSAREGARSPRRGATGSPHRGRLQSPDHERSESPDPMEQYARTKMKKSEIELEEKIVSLRRYAYELEIQKRKVTRDLEELENRKLPPNILKSWTKSGGNPRLTSPNRERSPRPEEGNESSSPVPVISPISQVTIQDNHSSAKKQGKSGYEEIVHGLKKLFPEMEAPKTDVGCPHSSSGAEKKNLRVDSYAITSYVMKLPDFHGEINAWPSYKSIYEQSKDSFSRFENIVRLRKSIKGEALHRVEVLFAANADPEVIIKEMDREYGRTGQLAFKEFNALKDLPPLVNKPAAIVRFAQKVRRTVLLFKTLGEENYLRSPELMQYLQVKLPDNMRSEWRKIQWEHNSKATLEHFQEFLDRQAEYCTVDLPMDMKQSTTRQSAHRTHTVMEDSDSEEERKTTSKKPAAKGKEKPVERKSDLRCRVCISNGHWSLDCPTFTNANSDKRWELARKHQMCFRCLHNRFMGHKCRTLRCGVNDCKGTHHKLLHFEKKGKEKTETVTNTWEEKAPQVYLKMVPVTVVGPAGESDEFALLDDGSTVSLVDEAVAAEVGVNGTTDPLRLETMGESIRMPQSKRITVTLSTRQGDKINFAARTVPSLSLSPQTITERDLEDCKHLQKIKKELVYRGAAPRILIGQDNWNLLLAKETVKGPDTQPIASLTALGWVLHGSHTRAIGHRVMYASSPSMETDVNKKLEEFFSLESLLIKPRRPDSDPEKRAEDILKKNTRITEENRIETALLWKEDTFEMPNNYDNALTRLRSVEKRIDKDPELKRKYTEQMESLVNKGYAEPAPKTSTQGKTWYLPHFDVKNPAKPEKFRIVHDAAAKTKGKSLNDFLLAGPDLLKSLPGVLMRFRQHPIAVSADIAEMFMQIKIRPEDRDALRYLWRGDRRDGAPQEYRMTSLIFGAASSPCTAIFAKDWNAKRYEAEYPAAVTAITENHYMDDYLDSFSSIEEAIETSKKVREIHSKAHLELRKWISNSTEVIEQIEPTTEATAEVLIGSKEEKILGLMWNPATDELGFNMKMARLPAGILDKQTVTKREALKTVMSLYDPLGFASPVTVNAKKILQESWRRNIDWDQELDDDLTAQWNEWKQHLQNLKSVTIPRCYTGYSNAVTVQLHTFTDASETAYAAVLYWRVVTADQRIYVFLVTAKAKVAPLKVTSIPRLELQAATMGSRMAAAVIEEHRVKLHSKHFWTDSKTVLSWIKRGARSFKPFVAHRIAEIEENSKVDEWQWVPTKLNVADIATRGVPPNLGSTHEWFTGMLFLREPPERWPREKISVIDETGEERVHACKTSTERKLKISLPDPERFSKWERLLRATARVLQFIDLCRKSKDKNYYKRTRKNKEKDPDWRKTKSAATQGKKSASVCPKPNKSSIKFIVLDAEYVIQAEKLLVRSCQEDSFGEDVVKLQEGRPVNKNSRLQKLQVEYRDGLITLRSRIAAVTDVNDTVKSPPIIDGEHRITQLYIEWTHRSLHHSGTEPTINEVRQHYWVIRVRPTTKKIVSRCLPCRIRKARPPTPPTGDHPRTRLAHHQRPFMFTALDYFGPISVSVGRTHQKRYVALFTCLTTRAVHLEVVASLSSDSAILAIRRFCARRSTPTEIHSDNGTNFHGADKELREALREEASRRGIVWRYITPGAPFMGGSWERLVRCVKNTLNTVLHEKHPTEEVLTTLVCEAEYTVNSRPLTHVSVDPNDSEAITPNHFLLGGSGRLPSPGSFDENDLATTKHWRRSQILADMFWRRWVREYLPELQYRREPHGRGPTYNVGDLVLIADAQLPRNTWPRGRIEAVYPGQDGQVRVVEVRTAGGILKRPTKKLVPLPQ